jgi:tetratricopeptide (TPR) repeat protein
MLIQLFTQPEKQWADRRGALLGLLVFVFNTPSAALAGSPGFDAYNKQDYEEAEKYFEKRAEQNPGDYRAQYDLGTSLYELNRYEESSQAFEKCVENKPDFQYGWYNLGMAYARQNRYRDALDAFGKALELNPKDKDAKQNMEVIRKRLDKNPKGDKSQNGRKLPGSMSKMTSKSQAGTLVPTDTPVDMPTPPPDRKNEKEDENSKNKMKDKNAKKKYKSNEPSDKSMQEKNADKKSGNGGNSQQTQEVLKDKQRQVEAKKELKLTDQQVQALMNQLQQQEKNMQQYYSANPKRDQNKQMDMWSGFPKEQQEFIRRFLGQPDKSGEEVPEDW